MADRYYAPVFHTFGSERPRIGALLDGGVLTIGVFLLVSVAINHGGYSRASAMWPQISTDRSFPGSLSFQPPPASGRIAASSGPRAAGMQAPAGIPGAWSGIWEFGPPSNLRLKVTVRNGQLFARLPGKPEVLMYRVSETRFHASGALALSIRFADGVLIAHLRGAELKARRRLP